MLSIVRTPLSTRLLNGHETKRSLGSSSTTSMEGSLRRRYFAALAPPQPPPITTTRRPDLGAMSPVIGAAQPAASAPSPSPPADVRRNRLRVIVLMCALRLRCGGIVDDYPRLVEPF